MHLLRLGGFEVDDHLPHPFVRKPTMNAHAVVKHSKWQGWIGAGLKFYVKNDVVSLKQNQRISSDRL